MELSSSPETGTTMPISVNYRPIHESFKPKIQEGHPGCVGGNGNFPQDDIIKTLEPSVKPVVKYRECLKNHAASMGGHAVDGCGDFMPSGEEGTLEGLKCAACGCHRNFHRREVDGEPPCYCFSSPKDGKRLAQWALPAPPLSSKPMMVRPSAQMIMALPSGHAQVSNDQDLHTVGGYMPHLPVPYHHLPSLCLIPKLTKRFRTKFTTEQKDKMYAFAEKLGWRIQKHDEAAVQQFCTDVGVKRHVLKVWMHNNKQTFSKKLPLCFPETFDQVPDSAA